MIDRAKLLKPKKLSTYFILLKPEKFACHINAAWFLHFPSFCNFVKNSSNER